jgi:hypothetical protein
MDHPSQKTVTILFPAASQKNRNPGLLNVVTCANADLQQPPESLKGSRKNASILNYFRTRSHLYNVNYCTWFLKAATSIINKTKTQN